MDDESAAPSLRLKLTKTTVDAAEKNANGDVVVWDTVISGFRLRVRATGRKTYEYRYRLPGGRQRLVTIGRHGSPWTADTARKRVLELQGEIAGGADPQQAKREVRHALTVSALIDDYLEHGSAEKPGKRDSSWSTDRYNLERHAKPLLGKRMASELTRADLSQWQSDVASGRTAFIGPSGKKRGVTRVKGGPGAAARAMRTLSTAFNWAVAREILIQNPAQHVRKIQDGRRDRFLTDEEARRLWVAVELLEQAETDGITALQGAAFKLLMLTGARRGEIIGLRWSEVDLIRRMLILPPARHKAGGTVRPRSVQLPPEGVKVLERLSRQGDFVFPAVGGLKPMSPPTKAWGRVLAMAGVSNASFQVLRHTLASFAIADGASLYAVGKVLGHSKSETTERYAHLRDDMMASTTKAAARRYVTPAPPKAKASRRKTAK